MHKIFFEVHRDLPREGPGNNEATRKAFTLLKNLPPQPHILDVGCGPGMQTVELAKISQGSIVAIDIFQQYLDQLQKKAEEEGVSGNIQPIEMSMDAIDFERESFDVIWSEGAIFVMGFEKGLREWRVFLEKGGYLVVSELTWIKSNPPRELKNWLEAEYPAIKSIKENIQIIKEVGYEFIHQFVLPEVGWWEHYYKPIEKRLITLRRKYDEDPEALKYLEMEELEIDFYRRYSDYYGYVFYTMKTIILD